jgi:hypothetical protein
MNPRSPKVYNSSTTAHLYTMHPTADAVSGLKDCDFEDFAFIEDTCSS